MPDETPLTPDEEREYARLELESVQLAGRIARETSEIELPVLASALGILFASIIARSDEYVSVWEQTHGTISTDEEKYQHIVDDIKARVEQMRALRAALSPTPSSNVQ
jgi:hypothetical protein